MLGAGRLQRHARDRQLVDLVVDSRGGQRLVGAGFCSEPSAGIGAPARGAGRRLIIVRTAVSGFWRLRLGVGQPTSDRSRTIRMLLVRAWRRSSA